MLTLLAATHQSIKIKPYIEKLNRKTVCSRNGLIEIGAISDEQREKNPIGERLFASTGDRWFFYDLFSNCAIEMCKDA